MIQQEIKTWRHVFKVDPARSFSEEWLADICESGTDAIIVGGSDGITIDNVTECLAAIRRYSVPCVLEVTELEALTPGFDAYLIPVVLNSHNPAFISGLHQQALKAHGPLLDMADVIGEGYCILNRDSSAAKRTNSDTALDIDDIEAFARFSDTVLRMPIFYLEYSGTYGSEHVVKKVSETLNQAQLFYGGGIKNAEQARKMASFADTIVVGNAIYEDKEEALKTVQAVRELKA
ncbi:heptaprenylglyceryl phosphate synthase [Geomicrobium sp. JSM 1781026]|uniref:heptaprenylglyceryl phosphate synthase n=1 Tax=unclassified Geomicrobium TaxID=2628951 RepID=UPI00045F13B9|nr:heptaprenylglyceryl phosphate synthase [Geomicrobium sp. JCM 19039]GAK12667.1 geranylgeranylglyceryl phosphate synthase-like protein YerE [Geomicrobium sp. JCM 19039]